jgi:hypothetical protein
MQCYGAIWYRAQVRKVLRTDNRAPHFGRATHDKVLRHNQNVFATVAKGQRGNRQDFQSVVQISR